MRGYFLYNRGMLLDNIKFIPAWTTENKKPALATLRAVRIHDVEIPKNFISDGGSVPVGLHWVAKPFGFGLKAFLVHDYRYATQEISRKEADLEMLRNLKTDGFAWWRRRLIYRPVRLFGRNHWKKP